MLEFPGSFCESDEVLSYPFNVEEVEHALKCLKPKRSGGPDNLAPEYVKHCGPFYVRLCKICKIKLLGLRHSVEYPSESHLM